MAARRPSPGGRRQASLASLLPESSVHATSLCVSIQPGAPPAHLTFLATGLGCEPRLRNDDDATTDDDDDSVVDDDDTGDDDVGDDDDSGMSDMTPFGASWYFVECGGECSGDLDIDESGAFDYAVGDWGSGMPWQLSTALTATGRLQLGILQAGVDVVSLGAVYGCPDCADGGDQYMEWDLSPLGVRTDYEYGDPPTALEDLDDAVFAMIEEAEACNFGFWLEPISPCVPLIVPLGDVDGR